MTGFKCKVTGATSAVPVSTPQLARRCGADPTNGRTEATPSNCTYGAKQPFYWYQAEGSTVRPNGNSLMNGRRGVMDCFTMLMNGAGAGLLPILGHEIGAFQG